MDIAQCLTEPQAIKHLLSILSAKTDNLEISADIRKMRYLGCYGKVEECRRVLLLLVTHALIRLIFVLLACRRFAIEVRLIIWGWEEVDARLHYLSLRLLAAGGTRISTIYLILRRLVLLILVRLLLLF